MELITNQVPCVEAVAVQLSDGIWTANQSFVKYTCLFKIRHVLFFNSLNAKCIYTCMHTQPLHYSCMI